MSFHTDTGQGGRYGSCPVNLTRICSRLNIQILSGICDNDKATSNIKGIAYHLGGRNVIFVNKSIDPLKQRFVVGHEIGHIILGHPNISFIQTGIWEEEIENEANRFSLCLLMPLSEVKEHLRAEVSPEDLSGIFKVPLEWVRVRLATLGDDPMEEKVSLLLE